MTIRVAKTKVLICAVLFYFIFYLFIFLHIHVVAFLMQRLKCSVC